MAKFSEAAKEIYGPKLYKVILYGSCACGDFEQDSDIDVMALLDVPQEAINLERKRILEVSDQLDWEYDVVLTPVFQNYKLYQYYIPVSKFCQNAQRDGVQIA